VLAILITVVVILLVLGAVYLVGSQASSDKGKPGRGGRGSTARTSSASKTKRPTAQYRKTPGWVRKLPLVLVIAAVACLIVAVAQFRVEQQQGTPVVALVLDTSNSMDARDVSPNRLAAAESAAQLFLQQLPEDFEVVLVTFADKPTVVVPATPDHATVSEAIGDLPRGKGTVIGDGLSSALDQIQTAQADASGKTPAAIVLLSDGQDTGSRTPPPEAASAAAARGVPVYTVVLGTGAQGTKPPDTKLLTDIANTTGATVSTAGSASELSNVYESLGAQLSSQLKISSSAQLFVFIAIALGMAAAVVTIVLSMRKQY
jgi:Ca-activated chloride channel family protein